MKAALVALAAVPLGSAQMSCSYSGPGVTYDFSGLDSSTGRMIRDNRNNTQSGFTPTFDYWFSVCQDMAPPQSGTTPPSTCNSTIGADGTVKTGPGPAFQVGNNLNSCYRLGDLAANGNIFPDPYNPSHGAVLSYTGGDKCAVFVNGALSYVPRSINVNFICQNYNGLLPTYDIIRETTTCQYDAFIFWTYGCPTQCLRGGPQGKICSANGICGWDATKNAARCFCNSGYSGGDCTILGDKGLPPKATYGGNITGGFFGGVFAGLAAALGFFAWRSYRSGTPFMDSIKLGGGGGSASSSGYVPADAYAAYAANTATQPMGGFGGAGGNGYVAPSFGNTDKDLLVT